MKTIVRAVQPDLIKGSIYVICAFFCMAVFGVLTKLASADGAELWVSFISYVVGTLGILPLIWYYGLEYLKSEHFPYHFGRAAFGLSASFLYMLSMQYTPIVNATLLFNTAPIFIPILATFWLKKHISKAIWLAVAIGFVGIMIIIKPTGAILAQPGDFLGLISGMSLAVAYLLIKILTPTDPGGRIVFYYFFLSTCFQVPFLILAGHFPDWNSFLYAAIAGLLLLSAQGFLVVGYKYADASQVGIYQYTSVIFVGLIEWLLWGLVPDSTAFLGVILVVIAAIVIIRSGTQIYTSNN